MIFSRSRGSGRNVKGDAGDGQDAVFDDDETGIETDEAGDGVSGDGPYDVSEAPSGIPQLDLGALRVPAVDGVEVRVQADPDGKVQQVLLVHEDSALQLGVFAAPRTEGIWEEVRAEIRKQLFTDGVAAEEVDGRYGPELRARVRTPEGLTDIRFVGVDGPRWLVRAVFQGAAAADPSVAPPLQECLRNLVVVRGIEAMPVREPLPLQLPKEVTEQAAANGEVQVTADELTESGDAPPRRRPSPRPRKR